ncbi:hypothetical protein ACLSY8_04235 [Avibacterium avium]|uniref:hypothetical protein n=1 Tax=Avibacterium avium TaxID=751 RepID=UPI003BF7C45D
MNNSLPLDPFATEKPKKSLAYFLGLGLGKVVVSARHKLSGVSQAIHHSIEDDVQKRLAAQEEYHDMLSQQQEIAYCEEMERLKRRHIKVTLGMTAIGLLMGGISTALLFWYY